VSSLESPHEHEKDVVRIMRPLPCREHVKTFAKTSMFLLSFLAAVALAGVARADVVELKDGRRFEGKIVFQDSERVRLDAKVGGIRTTVGFKQAEVNNIEEKEIPADFFEPAPAKRVSDPKKFSADQTLYLEVPVIGALGKQVFASGISQVLSYAKRNAIGHVVFVLDSTGGSVEEARAIYKSLRDYKDALKYHGIIRNCGGEALVLAVFLSTLHLVPGGKLGGPMSAASEASGKEDAEEQNIVWSQMAYKAVSDSGRSGRAAELLRALIDPSEQFYAWRDEAGSVMTGVEKPKDVPAEKLIVEVGDKEVLEVTYDQAVALGMPPFKGGAKDLGEVLKLTGWTPESDYGIKTMARVAAEKQKKAKAKESAFEEKVKNNVMRREATDRYIADNLKEAAQWDPTKGSYEQYTQHWNWGWGWSEEWKSNQWTEESQKKWRTRTDACMHFLQLAAKGLTTMKRLDAEAAKLGLDSTFKPGEIDSMIKDIQVKFGVLGAYREKKGD
jgi:hypothetical protein